MTKCIIAGIQAESVTSAAGTVNAKKKLKFPCFVSLSVNN